MPIFSVLSAWQRNCNEFTQFISMNADNVAKRLPTLRPSQLTWAVSPPVGCHHLHPPLPYIIITQPKGCYSFTVPQRVQG